MRVAAYGVVLALLAGTVAATPLAPSSDAACVGELARHAIGAPHDVLLVGVTPVSLSLDVPQGTEILVDAAQSGIDMTLAVGADGQGFAAHAETPVRRAGHQWAIVTSAAAGPLVVRLTGKEHPDVSGHTTVRLTALGPERLSDRCSQIVHALAAASASYARGQDVSRAVSTPGKASARHHYLLAVEEYSQAVRLLDAPADAPLRVMAALSVAAAYYQDLKDWARSADWAQRTRADAQPNGLDYEAARAGAFLAASWLEMAGTTAHPSKASEVQKSVHERMVQTRELLRELERVHRKRGELYDATLQLNNAGVAYYTEGNYTQAERIYRRASAMFGALHEWPRQSIAQQNIAQCQWGRGEVLTAVETYRKILEKLGPKPYPYAYVAVLANSALASFAAGDLDTSLRQNAKALEFAREIQAPTKIGQSLHGLGITYYAMGDRELARLYLDEALTVRTAALDPGGRMATLRALSAVYVDEGRIDAAVAFDQEALSLATSPSRRARMLIRLATDTAAAGGVESAVESLRPALDGPNAYDPAIRVEALIARGHIYRVSGRLPDAVEDLDAAVAIVARHDSPDQDFRANLELASAWEALGKPDHALIAIDRALSRSDELRRQSANPEFRAQRQAPLRPAYDLKLALLADRFRQLRAAGRIDEARRLGIQALQTAEHGRAQSLADLSSLRYSSNDATLRTQLERRERLYRDLAARRFRLDSRQDAAGAADEHVIALQADIAASRRDLDALNIDIAQLSGVRSSTLREVPGSWPRFMGVRAPDSVIIDFWVGDRGAYAWTISSDGIEWTMLGASAPITEAARTMHEAFKSFAGRPPSDRLEAAALVYDRVIRPLGARATSRRQIIVVPDGALGYVPFAALRTGRDIGARYLVEDHDVALAPAAWWLVDRRAPPTAPGPSRVLLLSDPIYEGNDPRLARQVAPKDGQPSRPRAPNGLERRQYESLGRLPWTAREAEVLAALVPSSQVDRLSGGTATRDRLLAAHWSEYRIIHLASHGMVDAAMPQLSALLLGAYNERGQRVEQAVRAVDLESLTLRADIVALSACDTAVGKEIAGEGVVGLAATTLARGAGAVLASLWPSSDEISARLMTEFYRGVLIEHGKPPSALGSAMRTMLSRNSQTDPAFWAVFQLSIGRLDGQDSNRDVARTDIKTREQP